METLEIVKFLILSIFATISVYLAIKADDRTHNTHKH